MASANAYTAINTYLNNLYSMETSMSQYGAITPAALIEQEVIVVSEPSTNNLIVSATPKYFQEIKKIIDELDKRPAMVLIQVLIAQVTLTDDEQFGIELGLQDGLLFDRSAAGPPINPGYAFNNNPLGNSANGPAGQLTTNNAPLVGTQGLSNFALNRADPTLGFGGLVLSASSESVNLLLRALKQNQRIEVLSRPQVMTMDNQLALVWVGQQVGILNGSTSAAAGQQVNTVTQQLVGLILQVTPRVSEDGVVVMAIDAIKSAVGSEAQGTPITAVNGQLIRQPPINQTQVQTTVSALDGQTIILGGLITKDKTDVHRKVPWIGDVPVLGRLFRFDSVHNERDELLIILTPHIVTSVERADELKKIEAARMNWCLGDVIALTGDIGLRPRNGDWPDSETEVIYPDVNPRAEKPSASEGKTPGETIPTPPPAANPDKNASPSAAPGVPPEPPRIPQPDAGAMAPQQRYMPANSAFYFNTNGQVPSQFSTVSQGVKNATYERPPPGYNSLPAAANSYPPYPNTAGAVTPTIYDAPPLSHYPATILSITKRIPKAIIWSQILLFSPP